MLSVFRAAAGRVVRGDVRYYAWMVFLLALNGVLSRQEGIFLLEVTKGE